MFFFWGCLLVWIRRQLIFYIDFLFDKRSNKVADLTTFKKLSNLNAAYRFSTLS